MASNAIKSPLTGDPLHPSEVLAKAALDERDEKSIIRLLKDAGVTSYEPRVLSHLVDRMRMEPQPQPQPQSANLLTSTSNDTGPSGFGYTLEVVQDARDYADHAGRTDIGMEDVRLAVRKKQDALATGPPTREDIIRQADEVNRIPLPPIPDKFGVRLPPLQYQTTLPNLQWDAEAEVLPDQDVNAMDVDPDSVHAQHGNRNKRAKTTPKFETKKPLTLREKKEQEELNRIKAEARAEAKAKRRMQALHSKRSN